MITMRIGKKDVLLSVVVLCTVFLMADAVKSDIVIKKQRTERSLSDELLRNNYLNQLIFKEDEYIDRKRSDISGWIKVIKTRNALDEGPAKKNPTEESISEPETSEPISKDYEIISPNVTFVEYQESYGIVDEMKQSGKPDAAVSSTQLTTNTDTTDGTEEIQKTSKLETTKGTQRTSLSETTKDTEKKGLSDTTIGTEEASVSETTEDIMKKAGNTEDTGETTETTKNIQETSLFEATEKGTKEANISETTEETKETSKSETTRNTEEATETTEDNMETAETTEDNMETAENTDDTGKTTDDKLLGSLLGAAVQPILGALKNKGIDLSKGMDLFNSLGVKTEMTPAYRRRPNFKAKGPPGGTKEPSTFIISMEPYTVLDDLFRAGLDSFRRINKKTEPKKKIVSKKKMDFRAAMPPAGNGSTSTINEETKTKKNLDELSWAAMPPRDIIKGSDSIGVIKKETETDGEASYVYSFMNVNPSNAGFEGIAYDQHSSGILNLNEAAFDGMAYYEDTPVGQDQDKRPLPKKSKRDLHLRKNVENGSDTVGKLNKDIETDEEASSKDSSLIKNPSKARSYGVAIDEESSLFEDQKITPSHKVAIDKDSPLIEDPKRAPSDKVAIDKDSPLIEDPKRAPSGKMDIDVDSSLIEDPNRAPSHKVAIDKDSPLIEDPKRAPSDEVAIDKDSPLIEDPKRAPSDKVAIDKDSLLIEDPKRDPSDNMDIDANLSLIKDPSRAPSIKTEGMRSKSSKDLLHRQDPGIPNRPAIVRVRRKDILLAWSPPKTDDGPPADGYIVEMKNEYGDYKVIGEPRMPYLEINHLRPGEMYFFRIKSINESGNSPPMIIKYFMDDEISAVPQVEAE